MNNDLYTLIGKYQSLPEIVMILCQVDEVGIIIGADCWIEKITLAQLERLVNGRFDA